MARAATHSATDVERVARQLKAANKQVTPYRVQRALGGSSFAWIKQTLHQLGFGPDDGLPDSLDPDTAELIRLVQPLVDRFQTQARADMDDAVNRHSEQQKKLLGEITALEAERNELTAVVAAESARVAALQKELAAAREDIDELRGARDLARAELQAAHGEITTFQARLKEAEKLAETQRGNLEAFRSFTKEHLDELRKSHGDEIQSLLRQLDEQRTQVRASQEDAIRLNRENAELVAEKSRLQGEIRSSQRDVDALKQKLQSQSEENAKLGQELSRVETRLEGAVQQVKSCQATADQLDKERSALKSAIERHALLVDQLIEKLPEKLRKENEKLIAQLTEARGAPQ